MDDAKNSSERRLTVDELLTEQVNASRSRLNHHGVRIMEQMARDYDAACAALLNVKRERDALRKQLAETLRTRYYPDTLLQEEVARLREENSQMQEDRRRLRRQYIEQMERHCATKRELADLRAAKA